MEVRSGEIRPLKVHTLKVRPDCFAVLDGLNELFVHDCSVARRWRRSSAKAATGQVGVFMNHSLEAVEGHAAAGDLRAALGVLRLLPREALHRAPTPPPTAEQREDVGGPIRDLVRRLSGGPGEPVSRSWLPTWLPERGHRHAADRTPLKFQWGFRRNPFGLLWWGCWGRGRSLITPVWRSVHTPEWSSREGRGLIGLDRVRAPTAGAGRTSGSCPSRSKGTRRR